MSAGTYSHAARINFEMWFDKLTMSGNNPLTLSPSKGRPEPVEGPNRG